VEDQIVVKLESTRVPYFNAHIYLENKQEVGKVDDIFGPISNAVRGGESDRRSAMTLTPLHRPLTPTPTPPVKQFFTINLSAGFKADSFKESQKFYIDPYKTLPMDRFLPGNDSGATIVFSAFFFV
jgi:H/ACA ribonucleoprotein complex subunit 1